MAAHGELDQPVNFIENALTFIVDEATGRVELGLRQDPRLDLKSLDEQVEPPPTPKGGWPEGTVMVNERPVLPLRTAVQRPTRPLASSHRPVAARAARRGASRERRSRPTRRTAAASRDGPSDDDGGDGEGPPPPVAAEREGHAPTNSPRTTTDCPPWSVGGHGIDTVAFGSQDPAAVQSIRTLAQSQAIDPATGRRQGADWKGRFMRLTVPVAGMTVGVYPGSGLVVTEARLAVMLAGDARATGLIPVTLLAEGAMRATATVEALLGFPLEGPVTVRRIDFASELTFIAGSEGLAFLRACERALHLARLDMVPHYATGEARLESITWQTPTGRATRIRLYDAGAHHVTHKPGERLRLEREQRWTGPGSPTPEQVVALDLAALFRKPIRSWLSGTIPLRVSTQSSALALLYDQARRGTRTVRSANMLGAKVNALALVGDLLTSKDRRRREKALRDEGIVLDHSGDPQSSDIDLHAPLAALAAAWGPAQQPDQGDTLSLPPTNASATGSGARRD
jgi:hypothetical protein